MSYCRAPFVSFCLSIAILTGLFKTPTPGLFPGLVYYLTFWYRQEERSIRVAIILASATLAGAFGGAIAYGVGHMNGTAGLSGWRWLFILEGIPSVISAFFVWFWLPDYPETASWLSAEEKALAAKRLAAQGSHGDGNSLTWAEAKETLLEWRLWAHYIVGFNGCYLVVSGLVSELTAGVDLLWHLDAIFESVAVHAVHHSRSRCKFRSPLFNSMATH